MKSIDEDAAWLVSNNITKICIHYELKVGTYLSTSWTSKKEFVGFVVVLVIVVIVVVLFSNIFQLFHIEIMVIVSWNGVCANHLVQVWHLKTTELSIITGHSDSMQHHVILHVSLGSGNDSSNTVEYK